MEILDYSIGMLTNAEVLSFLSSDPNCTRLPSYSAYEADVKAIRDRFKAEQRQHQAQAHGNMPQHTMKNLESAIRLQTLVRESLAQTPCSVQTPESIQQFLTELHTFCSAASPPLMLTQAEIVMLVNLRPETVVEIHCIMEECDERISPEQQEGLLAIVRSCLPQPPEEQQMEEDEAQGRSLME